LYAAIDLHGDNGYVGICDDNDRRLYSKRLPNDIQVILKELEPYRDQLSKGIVVESTYNWYWLVDGLREHRYQVHLANPAQIQQYNGMKNSDDKSDAFYLAHLHRLGILPVGHIYPKEERPVRDLLRRRLLLVQQRTEHVLSFESLIARETGKSVNGNHIKQLQPEDVNPYFADERLRLMGRVNIRVIRFLTEQIREIEEAVLKEAQLKPEYEKLQTTPGIGKILALTIMLETGDINRFARVGNFTSYCRCVKAKKKSNEKVKGEGNRKNGNKYLGWAFVEAANFCRRYCPEAKSWYQRKAAQTKQVIAIKALASKLAKASYFILKDQVEFDVKRIFG
jgi:transposase